MTTHPTCIDCGDTYLSRNGYHGYYCPECHGAWQGKQQPAPKRSRRLRFSPSPTRSTRPTRPTRPSITRRTPEQSTSRRRHGREK
ncbi:DUF7564 family protein [Halogranum gelatinilyticum]|uniref:DUF7564 family protein n=1 Tax=Halogranum gelatinilyticum TaxID=660521 RepID=UPI00111397E4|nr:hypothetical protein [Halogranum gelatinilyticum]